MADQIVTDVRSIGTDIVAEKNKAVQFVKDRWPHFITWLLVTAGPTLGGWILKHVL